MRIIITYGPSYEPIDQVRRLTNLSTGKLGVTLTTYFSEAGHEVICLRGEGSTFAGEPRAASVTTFSTNDNLARSLEMIAQRQRIDAIFHAAALCDYRVERVLDAEGAPLHTPKFATRDGQLHLVLSPATKVLPKLRTWFPHARIVGWKYELAGTREDPFEKAWKQLHDCKTDACVLNGAAYGEGFALCLRDQSVRECRDVQALCENLRDWLQTSSLRTTMGR